MKRLLNVRKLCLWTVLGATSLALTIGTTCPVTGDNTRPVVPPGNRPPRIIITSVTTAFGNNFAEVGESVSIAFSGEDAEDAAVARVFASTSGNPTPAQEIPILGGFPIGPGTGNGVAVWDTTGFAPGAYNIFAEIDDRTLDPFTGTGNPPVRVTFSDFLQLGAVGSRPPTSPPQVVFVSPVTNLGVSAEDELTVRYIHADVDSTATITLLLDKDLNPNNDDVNNPGDPLDANSKILILPSAAREPQDPVFDGDVLNDPAMPIVQPNSLEVRRNPRTLPQTVPGQLPFPQAPLAGNEVSYIFKINFAQIPPRPEPYFLRATITDGTNVRHRYAVGSVNISASANGTVDINTVGFGVAGARFRGFAHFANLGSSFLNLGDLDRDGINEFLIASRYASPRGRPLSGAAYLIYGRRKLPFPQDTDGDGRPDGGVLDENDQIVNFPEAPGYLSNPYDPSLVGRFGGQISIEAVGSTPGDFIRGTIYVMPRSWGLAQMPAPLLDPTVPAAFHAGLSSVAAVNLTGIDEGVEGIPMDFVDTIPDLIFGMPFVSAAQDYHDDDPADGCEVGQYVIGNQNDMQINNGRCEDGSENDNIWTTQAGDMAPQPHQGLVVMVDATNNTVQNFPKFIDAGMAGQFDPEPRQQNLLDDEGIIQGEDSIPRGARLRGGWFGQEDDFTASGFIDPTGYGLTVSAIPSVDNDEDDDLVVSMPFRSAEAGLDDMKGAFQVWLGDNFIDEERTTDGVFSFPNYKTGDCPGGDGGPCTEVEDMEMSECIRCRRPPPISFTVEGAESGDTLGWAGAGGDVNLDSNGDIVVGAPGADRGGFTDNGVVYVLYTGGAGFASPVLGIESVANLQVWGSHDFDGFGKVQTGVQSMNGDNIDDTVVASEGYDDNVVGPDAGFVGVMFGAQDAIGVASVDDIGTAILPGVVFIGVAPGARAGASVSTAGDFNGDGTGDLLIAAPGETRIVNGQARLGVAYLIFGGPHLTNQRFSLNQVGSAALPGIVFICRTLQSAGPGTEEARIDIVGSAGDADGDGFDDILLGAPKADFVNTLNPTQRLLDAGEVYLIYGNNFGTNSFVIP